MGMMKGCSTAFFMWLPVLILKILKGIWLLISWILQTISGTPLYHCKPEYRIPAQIIGTTGLFFSFFCMLGIFISIFDPNYIRQAQTSITENISAIFFFGVLGILLLLLCRYLIRRGSN